MEDAGGKGGKGGKKVEMGKSTKHENQVTWGDMAGRGLAVWLGGLGWLGRLGAVESGDQNSKSNSCKVKLMQKLLLQGRG